MRQFKEDFPLLRQSDLVYLDSAATAQRPGAVLEAEREFYEKYNANPLRNTTESINLVAYSYGLTHLKTGDEILVTIDSHHSNLLPWQMVARQTGATLRYLDCEQDGAYEVKDMMAAVTPQTKLLPAV